MSRVESFQSPLWKTCRSYIRRDASNKHQTKVQIEPHSDRWKINPTFPRLLSLAKLQLSDRSFNNADCRRVSISNRYQRVSFCHPRFYSTRSAYVCVRVFCFIFVSGAFDCPGWFWWIGGNFRYKLLRAAVSRRGWQLANYSRDAWSAISSPRWKRESKRPELLMTKRYRRLSSTLLDPRRR